jgi:hypothetical protein
MSADPPSSLYPSGPDVIVDFIFDRGMLFISIHNIGDKPAYEVRVKFSENIRGAEGIKDISALPLFRDLEFLAPHKKIATFLDSSASYFRNKQPTKIAVEVAFKDSSGAQKTVTIRHNLEIYRDIVHAQIPSSAIE